MRQGRAPPEAGVPGHSLQDRCGGHGRGRRRGIGVRGRGADRLPIGGVGRGQDEVPARRAGEE